MKMGQSVIEEPFAFGEKCQPSALDELSALLKRAAKERLSVIPWGRGTHQRMGHPPRSSHLQVSSGKLDGFLEHSAGDLTVCVQAGMTLEDLQQRLQPYGQCFPFWAPDAAGRTLGGLLSTGAFNFSGSRHGGLRELVLGLQVCLADGSVVRSGGRVVKNVSGYEMAKLYVGSMGSVAFLASCTLRLSPIQERLAFVQGKVSEPGLGFQALALLFKSNLLLDGACLRLAASGCEILAWLSGKPRVVASQCEKIASAFSQARLESVEEVAKEKGEAALVLQPGEIEGFGFFPPAHVSHLYSAVQGMSKKAGIVSDQLFLHNGAFFVSWRDDLPAVQRGVAGQDFTSLNQWISKNGGWIAYKKVPSEVWPAWPMWGEERPEWGMSIRLKEAFDPGRILNPGRFVGRV